MNNIKNTHRLPAHVIPQRYKIMLKPNLEGFRFEGEETIFFDLLKETKEITLHSADLEITEARIRHGQKSYLAKISYDQKKQTATFSFPKKFPKGKGQISLKFKGLLEDKMRGFYKSKYVLDGEDRYLATTQFEATDARRAFPCFDEPSQKAIFDVTLMVPAGMVAISNTTPANILEHESGYRIVEFVPTPKMSTYLLAFIVGDFEYIEGYTKDKVLVRVFTTRGKKDQAKFALSVAIKCLEFYNRYFGINYPLPVLDMIAIPDFAAGAMENWGAVTYRESTLLIDEEKSSSANKQWVALVIAHELAHQWFGDLVTMQWWTHLWLNEGFASFIEYLAIDHIFPEWDIWTQFVGSEMGGAYKLDALKNTHPIEVEVKNPAEISEIFDTVSYEKGASILRMLHEYLGAQSFREGLRLYLKRHAYGNAQTKDLWQALEEASGKPVGKIMANWTAKPGHPVISVKCKMKSAKLELTQSRFFSSPISRKETKDTIVWNIPLKVQSAKFKVKSLLMNKKTLNVNVNHLLGGLKLNAGEASFVRVDYPQKLLYELENGIKNRQLSASDRLGLIRDTFSLAQSGQTPTTLALELALSYRDEEDYTVWAELTGHLAQIDSLLALESFYPSFQSFGREIFSKIAQKMGWEKKKGEKHTNTLLRVLVLGQLGGFGDLSVIKKSQELFKGGKIEPDLRGVVYNLVAENGGQAEWDKLVKMYNEEDNQQEKDRLGRSLGKFKGESLLLKTLQFAISKHVRYQNTLGIIASVWGNPDGRYAAWEFVKKNWQLLKDRYAGTHYFIRVFTPAGDFTKTSDAKDIKKFVKKNPVVEVQRTIAQVLEQIYANNEWLKRDRKKIKNFLDKVTF